MSNLAHLHARRASISLTTAPQCHSCFDELICYSVKGLNPGDSSHFKSRLSPLIVRVNVILDGTVVVVDSD